MLALVQRRRDRRSVQWNTQHTSNTNAAADAVAKQTAMSAAQHAYFVVHEPCSVNFFPSDDHILVLLSICPRFSPEWFFVASQFLWPFSGWIPGNGSDSGVKKVGPVSVLALWTVPGIGDWRRRAPRMPSSMLVIINFINFVHFFWRFLVFSLQFANPASSPTVGRRMWGRTCARKKTARRRSTKPSRSRCWSKFILVFFAPLRPRRKCDDATRTFCVALSWSSIFWPFFGHFWPFLAIFL